MSKRGNGANCVSSGDGKDAALSFIAKAKARAALAKATMKQIPVPKMAMAPTPATPGKDTGRTGSQESRTPGPSSVKSLLACTMPVTMLPTYFSEGL